MDKINIENKVFLAPLAGISDRAFREICVSFGADITVSEMISAKGLYYKDKNTARLSSSGDAEKGKFGIQLFGSEPDIIEYAVKKISELSPLFIDINMGCPVPKIVGNHEGSYLMTQPKLVFDIVKSAVNATDIPVSVKMRAGFTGENKNAPEIAKAAEDAGAAFVTVHGRTKEMMYSGKADLEIIGKVKQTVKIPVVGNGDIFSYEDAVRMKNETDCDAVMVARGALGNPYIFEEIKCKSEGKDYKRPSDREKLETALQHLRLIIEYKGEKVAIPESRKHMAWYLKGMKNSAETKNKIFTAESYGEIEDILENFLLQK